MLQNCGKHEMSEPHLELFEHVDSSNNKKYIQRKNIIKHDETSSNLNNRNAHSAFPKVLFFKMTANNLIFISVL